MPSPIFLGLDAGLTSTKAVVIDATGRILGFRLRPRSARQQLGGTK